MRELDIKKCELDNEESCYHLTRKVYKEKIAQQGICPDIGIRSKDGMGKERTPKVFFAKSLEGTLIFLNRNFNIFYSAVKHNNFAKIKGALKDDNPELYEQIFDDMVHENMSQEELTDTALELGKLYLDRGIYYKVDLKHCTKEEFQEMNEQEQDEIDYFSNDINEERPDERPTINNMHTRTGRGIKPSQMTLILSNGKESALEIAISMSEFYKTLNPGKPLPVLEFKDGTKDKPLLEILASKINEKSTKDLGKESLKETKNIELLGELQGLESQSQYPKKEAPSLDEGQ